jgi:hypothetical protein
VATKYVEMVVRLKLMKMAELKVMMMVGLMLMMARLQMM